ncbi:MAG: hypothetical protein M3Y91_01705 [Actinomycetota bacterium]|nr:hypothetical protein [Actinomycetota bacterium]
MTDEATDQEQSDEVTGPNAGPDTGPADDPAPGETQGPSRRPRRTAAVAGGVAVVVVVLAAVGYQQVIPITHVDRSRLARLVVNRPGIKEFDTKPAQAVELPVAKTGLSVLESAAKKAPDTTGAYLAVRTGGTSNHALETVAFLAPSAAVAKRLEAQVVSSNLSAQALASSSLNRLSTFTVPGAPGSAGSLYAPAAKTAGASQLAVTAVQEGRVVTVSEALHPTSAEGYSTSATIAEYHHLQTTLPGFSLKVVHRPLTATILWAAGAVLIALLIALSPVIVGRTRLKRRERREAEDRARGRVVPGHRITKRQR